MKVNVLLGVIGLLAAGLGLTGCATSPIVNLTPGTVRANSSNIYTFSFRPQIVASDLVNGSERATLVVNGRSFAMTRLEDGTFSHEVEVPGDQSDIRYFFKLSYMVRPDRGTPIKVEEQDPTVRLLKLTNRFVSDLGADRGPVGARIPLSGHGFTRTDVIIFGGAEVPTFFESANAIVFYVPPVEANQTYAVQVETAGGRLPVGNFRVDGAKFEILPESFNLAPGDRSNLIVRLDFPAPPGGLLLDVETNIPASVVMDEVIVPEGARTVTIPIQAGTPGNGLLFVRAPGFTEVQIPFVVR